MVLVLKKTKHCSSEPIHFCSNLNSVDPCPFFVQYIGLLIFQLQFFLKEQIDIPRFHIHSNLKEPKKPSNVLITKFLSNQNG